MTAPNTAGLGWELPADIAERVARARTRIAVHEAIRNCTDCELSAKARPVPCEGSAPSRFVVVGEAPGQHENRAGRPFIGPAGRLLRKLMREARINPDAGLFCNAVSCWPYGTPEPQHIDACRGHLDRQLDLADSPFVLAAGQTALGAFVGDVAVTAVHGVVLTVGGRLVMPIYHPSYLLRDRGGRSRRMVVEALFNFGALVERKLDPSWLIGEACVAAACGRKADVWDERGVAYCARHEKAIGVRRRRTRREVKRQWLAAQGTLEGIE